MPRKSTGEIIGRPSVWDASLGKTKRQGQSLPETFYDLIKKEAFKQELNALMLKWAKKTNGVK